MTYSSISTPLGTLLRRDADGAIIPDDPANVDRQQFDAWIAAGNALPTPTLSELKSAKRAALATRRKQSEIAGVVVNGMSVPTDEKTQAKLTAAVVAAMLDPAYSVNWKLADGAFVVLDAQTLISVAQAVRAHVQACFDHEAALVTAVEAAAAANALDAIDIEAGWPK